MEVSRLSESQQLALSTYTSVTNQEPDAAVLLLQRSEWNVQVSTLILSEAMLNTAPLRLL